MHVYAGIKLQIGRPLNSTDIAPTWDRIVETQGNQAIIVYPQSSGYAGTGNEAVEGQGDKYRQVRTNMKLAIISDSLFLSRCSSLADG
jgi:hypothetical protein